MHRSPNLAYREVNNVPDRGARRRGRTGSLPVVVRPGQCVRIIYSFDPRVK